MATPLETLRRALDAELWPSALLIAGENEALRAQLVSAAEESLDEEDRATGIDRFDEGPIARVLDSARTMPLLGGRRVVIARDPEGFASGAEHAKELLLAYLQAPPAHALLVLVLAKLDKRLKLVKAIAKSGLILECALPKEREMPAWVAARAKDMRIRLTGDAIQLIADAVGTDTGLATRELEKLSLIADPEGAHPLSAREVEELLSPGRAVGAFTLEDALLAGKLRPALEALDRHLAGASFGAPLALLGRLASISRRLATAASVVEGGGSEDDVREALGCHPFVAQKYARAARRRARHAELALAACVAADGMLKSGRNAREALTRVVVALAPGRQEQQRS